MPTNKNQNQNQNQRKEEFNMLNTGFHLSSSRVTRSIIETTIPCYYGVLLDTDYGKSKINTALSEYEELINKHFADEVEVELIKTFPDKNFSR